MGENLTSSEGNDGLSLQIPNIPKTALQAIYHAVTGKTENLSKEINGNVIIDSGDIYRLYDMLLDQLGVLQQVFTPTVTVVVKHANNKSVTYSSWEKFKTLQLNNHDITSEFILKLECVLKLPETPGPQRCIVTVNLDSSLPVITMNRDRGRHFEPFGILFYMRKNWTTVQVSIDFVDFIVAKAFCTVVEEWFSTLKKTPEKPLNNFLLKRLEFLRTSLGQTGRIGMAAFLAAYVIFSDKHYESLPQATFAVALGLLIWAIIVIIETEVTPHILRRVSENVVPAVILLNDGDKRAFDEIKSSLNSPFGTMLRFAGTIALTIFLNILSSFICTYLAIVQK